MERFGWTFCPGDKVMQVANDYDRDVFNGDLGVITGLDMEEGELTVSFDGRPVVYGFGELDELVLAYATTIHKAQGSEYPAVVIPLTHAALHHAGAQPALHRRDPRQAAGGAGRAAPGAGHRGQERQRTPALVQAARVARAGIHSLRRGIRVSDQVCEWAGRRYSQPRSRNG